MIIPKAFIFILITSIGWFCVAEHGSWSRSKKSGYRIAMASFDRDKVNYETFIPGWLQNEIAWGRPVYVLILKDGSMLISDGKAGAIYRIYYP